MVSKTERLRVVLFVVAVAVVVVVVVVVAVVRREMSRKIEWVFDCSGAVGGWLVS